MASLAHFTATAFVNIGVAVSSVPKPELPAMIPSPILGVAMAAGLMAVALAALIGLGKR